jgi:hypothetical protein
MDSFAVIGFDSPMENYEKIFEHFTERKGWLLHVLA